MSTRAGSPQHLPSRPRRPSLHWLRQRHLRPLRPRPLPPSPHPHQPHQPRVCVRSGNALAQASARRRCLDLFGKHAIMASALLKCMCLRSSCAPGPEEAAWGSELHIIG